MTLALCVGGIIAVLGWLFWYGQSQKQAGADAAGNAANKEALNEVVEANRPATAAELDDVRKRFERP